MKKPDSLRAALTAALPGLAKEPENLQVFIDKGHVCSTGRPASPTVPIAFEYRYRLNLLLLNFTDDPDVLFAALLLWLRDNQRQLLDRYAMGEHDLIKFDADVLDTEKVDLSIELELSERVIATVGVGGVLTFGHPAEPGVTDEDDYPGAALTLVVVDGDTVLQGG